jgi:hypothetical protein
MHASWNGTARRSDSLSTNGCSGCTSFATTTLATRKLAERCKDLIWATAQQVPAAGTDVVLDSNQWSRTHRATWRDKAMAAGYHPILHYLAGARRDRHRSGRTPCSRRGQRRSPPRWPSRTASRPPLRSPNPRQGLEVRIGKQRSSASRSQCIPRLRGGWPDRTASIVREPCHLLLHRERIGDQPHHRPHPTPVHIPVH